VAKSGVLCEIFNFQKSATDGWTDRKSAAESRLHRYAMLVYDRKLLDINVCTTDQ